jgi:hypothetical protein
MTPTREELQAVADWLGIEIEFAFVNGCDTVYQVTHGRQGGRYSEEWQPHLPGADCFLLMAALLTDYATTLEIESYSGVIEMRRECEPTIAQHNNTIESKAAALASAVFQCAVRVAMEAKR